VNIQGNKAKRKHMNANSKKPTGWHFCRKSGN
jgi:hypothetical protein